MSAHNSDVPAFVLVGDSFLIDLKGETFECRALKANGRILYQIKLMRSYLYITKTINQHGIPFWTAIPQDLRIRMMVAQLGSRLEDHLMETLCATTIVSK